MERFVNQRNLFRAHCLFRYTNHPQLILKNGGGYAYGFFNKCYSMRTKCAGC